MFMFWHLIIPFVVLQCQNVLCSILWLIAAKVALIGPGKHWMIG